MPSSGNVLIRPSGVSDVEEHAVLPTVQLAHWAARSVGSAVLPQDQATTLVEVDRPFSQVHGHSSLYDWQQQRFRVSAGLVRVTTLDEEAKHETTTLEGGRVIGVDPAHGVHPRRPWWAWEVRLDDGSAAADR